MKEQKTVLGIKSSGRKIGNSSIILTELLKPAKAAGFSVEWIDLNTLNIKHCIGCVGCNNKDLVCTIKDDLQILQEKIINADGIALVSPCYALGAPSILKSIADRSATWGLSHIMAPVKKRFAASVSVGGGDEDWMSLQRILPSLVLELCDCQITGQFSINKTALKGEVLLSPSKLQIVRELGENLVKSIQDGYCHKMDIPVQRESLTCPNCYSDVFNLSIKGTIQCAVCGVKVPRRKKMSWQIRQFKKNRRKFGISKFSIPGAEKHFSHIAGKMETGFSSTDERIKRLNAYQKNGMVFQDDYVPPSQQSQEPDEMLIQWEADAVAAFESNVPFAFKKFVKKAIDNRARAMGVQIVTKELFLQMKKEAGA